MLLKKLATLLLFTFFSALLAGCSLDPSIYSAGLRSGMTMGQVASSLYGTTYVADDPFQTPCFREAYSDKNMGIISSSSQKAFYIFKDYEYVNQRCGSTSVYGVYLTWYRSLAEARRFVAGYSVGTASRPEPISSTTPATQATANTRSATQATANTRSATQTTANTRNSIKTLNSRLQVGLKKWQARNILYDRPQPLQYRQSLTKVWPHLYGENPFGTNCFRLYDKQKEIEILAGPGLDHFYVFNSVLTSSSSCAANYPFMGDGEFVAVMDSMDSVEEYLASIRVTITYSDGNVYTGFTSDGKPHGAGTMAYSNGDLYEGDFSNDEIKGVGTYTGSDGSSYVGEFANGNFNGIGNYYTPDGSILYEGEFLDDEFNGEGTYYNSDGSSYVGEFANGNFNGRGILTTPEGETLEGIFENDELIEIIAASDGFAPQNNDDLVSSDNELRQASSGSGFAITNDGYIITNNHVIQGCQNVRIHRNSNEIEAVIIARDEVNDLALLKANFIPEATFALADNTASLMQDIYVAGFPFGENISSSIKVTKGIVSSLSGIGNNYSEIQIDAAIQPGNSGGPIFDETGNILGVAVSTLNAETAFENFGAIPQNTNFGVKSSIVANLLTSNGIEVLPARSASFFSSIDLGELATNATFYLSCWMTLAQIQEMSTTKVMFDAFIQQ